MESSLNFDFFLTTNGKTNFSVQNMNVALICWLFKFPQAAILNS